MLTNYFSYQALHDFQSYNISKGIYVINITIIASPLTLTN